MNHYQQIISEATGVTNSAALAWMEDHMRHEIFHSTLDWQSAAQLRQAAREAKQSLDFLGTAEAHVVFPELVAAAQAQGAL